METQRGGQNKHQTSTSPALSLSLAGLLTFKNVPHPTQFPLQPTHRPTDPHYGVEGASQTCTLTFQLLWITSVCHAAEKKLTSQTLVMLLFNRTSAQREILQLQPADLRGSPSLSPTQIHIQPHPSGEGPPGGPASAKTFKPTKQARTAPVWAPYHLNKREHISF